MVQLLLTEGLLPRILDLTSSSAEWDVRKEACYVICNISTSGLSQHVHQLVSNREKC